MNAKKRPTIRAGAFSFLASEPHSAEGLGDKSDPVTLG
jgi:hypothetical protein